MSVLRCIIMAALLCRTASLAAAEEGALAARRLTIAVIPKGTTHEYWESVHAGAIKAQRELARAGRKVEIVWKGPFREDDRDQQIQVVENFMTRRVSGIVLAPLDSQALVRPVLNAIRAQIPVIIIDSGLNTDQYVSFVATDNSKGGELAGERIVELLHGRGNVILLRYAVGSASTEQREAGFLAVLKRHPGIRLISSDQYAGPTRETAYQASQNLLNRFGREVNGIFTPNETSTIGMTMALRDIGKAGGKVKMVGFDSGTQSVNDLARGDVQGLVVQDPVAMGYQGVKLLVAHLEGKPVPKRLDTGEVMVTPENMTQPQIKALLHPPLDEYLH